MPTLPLNTLCLGCVGVTALPSFSRGGHLAWLNEHVRLALACCGLAVTPSHLTTLASFSLRSGFVKALDYYWYRLLRSLWPTV